MRKVKELVKFLDQKFPFELASSFDQGKMGLQVGSAESEVSGILITLDVTNDVVDEAIEKGANVIISHHPFIFNPIIRIDYDETSGIKLVKVIKNNINIINMHTNYDSAFGGMNDELAQIISLNNVKSYFEDQVDNNFLRYGTINELALKDLALIVKEKFNQTMVRVIGDLDKKISTVGIVGGSGAVEIDHALEVNCDVLITGEVKQNHALYAREKGLAIIEVSHHVESLFKEPLKNIIEEEFANANIFISEKDVDPFTVI